MNDNATVQASDEVVVRLRAVDLAVRAGVSPDYPALKALRRWAHRHALVEMAERSRRRGP